MNKKQDESNLLRSYIYITDGNVKKKQHHLFFFWVNLRKSKSMDSRVLVLCSQGLINDCDQLRVTVSRNT